MATQTSFPNPPITEALLDIKVDLPQNVDIRALEDFQKKYNETFPERQVKIEWKAQFTLKQNTDPQVETDKPKQNGYLYYSGDKKRIAQARLDGFTFNKLKPYHSWESFIAEATELWEHYKELFKPIKVKRIALRYINKIELPMPIKSFDEYFKTKPIIDKAISQQLESFLMKLVLPATVENPNKAVVIQTTADSKDDKFIPVILDIDVYRELELNPDDKKTIETVIQQLHSYKNIIFLNSVTEKTQKLFY